MSKSTYKQIPETTFGSSPAAKYLVAKLNEAKNPVLLRNVGKQISATCKQVSELTSGYYKDTISPKTLANTLRLMRDEVKNSWNPPYESEEYIVQQLRINV